jgi:hypothetical protein
MICKQQHKDVETMVIAFYRTRHFVNCTPCTGLTGADVEIADWEEEGSLSDSLRFLFSVLCLESGDHSTWFQDHDI